MTSSFHGSVDARIFFNFFFLPNSFARSPSLNTLFWFVLISWERTHLSLIIVQNFVWETELCKRKRLVIYFRNVHNKFFGLEIQFFKTQNNYFNNSRVSYQKAVNCISWFDTYDIKYKSCRNAHSSFYKHSQTLFCFVQTRFTSFSPRAATYGYYIRYRYVLSMSCPY